MKKNNISALSLSLLFMYALRSFLRNKKKNAILILVIAAALLSYIYINSLLIGIKEGSIKNIMQYEDGEISLMNEIYFENPKNPVRDTIAFSEAAQEALEHKGWLASPHLRFYGNVILQSPPFPVDGSLNFGVLAIDFDRDRYMQTLLGKHLIETKNNANMEEIISMLDNQDGVLIGQWFANKISANIGDTIFVIAKGKGGFTEQIELEIVGIYKSPNLSLDRNYFIMSYFNANDYLLVDEYTNINLVKSTTNLQEYQSLLLQRNELEKDLASYKIQNLAVKTYREVQLKRNGTLVWDVPSTMAFLYTFFILIIAAAGISNSTAMNIITRSKEIGTLQAFGMTSAQIKWLYTFEMLIVGIVASIIACILGVGVMAFLVYKGIDYSVFFKESSFGFSATQINGAWDFLSLLRASIIGILFTVIIELFVMGRLKKQYTNIIEMLRAQS